METTSNKLMTNTVATAAALGLIDYDFNLLAKVLREHFGGAGKEKVGEDNVKAARAGFEYARERVGRDFSLRIKPRSYERRMLLNGNEAVALGAMAAGCKFVAGYPMTPSTPILEFMADKGRPYGIVMVQPEDEIAAINMAVGAGFAGVRSMTATSGGGFALMVEALSFAGISETPVVIVLGQRPGPAVGLPTRTEQGELLFALHAGHGEFPRALLSPATVEDCFPVTVKAFNLAEKYQVPVIILTDHYLASSYSTAERFDLSQVKIDRGLLLSEEEANEIADYKRHQITESGVSPRALPSVGKALVLTDSDEHDEAGHLIESAEIRTQMVLKRLRKMNGLRDELSQPRVHEALNAEMTLIGWGSSYGAIMEAAGLLKEDGVAVNVLHLNELWPFPTEAVSLALSNKSKNIVIESNATGQLAGLIRRETGIKVDGNVNRFDGRPISPRYIVNMLKKEVS